MCLPESVHIIMSFFSTIVLFSYSHSYVRYDILILTLFVCWTAGNAIGDEGAIGIAERLERNTSLRVLKLGGVFPPHLFFIHCPTPFSCDSLLFDVNGDELCVSHFCD
jgi:hypothetical protein